MTRKTDTPLGVPFSFTCGHCRTVNTVPLDPQQAVADYVLKYLEKELPALLDSHLKDVSAGSGQAGDEIGQLKQDLDDSSQQREAMERQIADLTARLEEKIADQTSARSDIGTSTHTAHRQLAGQISGLSPRFHRIARAWAQAANAATTRRALSERAAAIFRLLLAPDQATAEERQHWATFTSANVEAQSLAQDAAELASQIADLPGYQQWIWDMVPAGTRYDPDLHTPWRSCDDTGAAQFVVIPAYLVDFSVLAKPQVFTNWPDPA